MNKKAKATSEKKRKAEESKEAKDCKTVKIKFNKTLKKSNNYTVISEGIKPNKSNKILQLEINSNEESKELKDKGV